MTKRNFLFFLYLFILGIAGISSLLYVPFNYDLLPEDARELLEDKFTEFQLRFLSLVNPLILLSISVVMGCLTNRSKYERSMFLMYIKKVDYPEKKTHYFSRGLMFGLISSAIVGVIYFFFRNIEQIKFLNNTLPEYPLITKIFYGGIAEEVIVRWGWLSLIYYLALKVFKKNKIAVILAIIISAILFSIGHLPVVFQYLETSVDGITITYILLNNFLLGSIFGYLFLRYNLETAIIAHISFHVLNYIILSLFM